MGRGLFGSGFKAGSILHHHEVFWSVRMCSGAACSVKHDRIHYIDVCPAGQPAKECAFGGTGLERPFGDRNPRGPDPP
ncbi:BnaCnng23990D [Brassica napus]|uniref:BnaCnng23990D protein n=2 Tax=Brassica napus TaxID=3708 RepID=A0A078ISN3_BRANA|nr:BnaCnng23990D [Brassica napus]